MNPDLDKLQPYPFEKLNALLGQVTPNPDLTAIPLSIGEPKHPTPKIVLDELSDKMQKVSIYPSTKGLPELRQSIATWAQQRFGLDTLCSETQVLPVNGTREALFSFTQAVIDRQQSPLVVSPNPFYQIYEGATYLAGANLHLLPTCEETNFIPDYDHVPEHVWQQCQILFMCSPGNPTGAVTPIETLKKLIALADKYDFIIASDECYSEIYCDEAKAPVGLLQACAELNRHDYRRCAVFHSLSKRSNLPGLRSGFVAGDADIMRAFLKYRTYHGCAMSVQNQLASIVAWNDETHVIENRQAYRNKFKALLDILSPVMDIQQTDASFYLWPKTPVSDETFAQGLYQQEHVTVLPGSYLSRTIDGINPGQNRIRMALVAPEADCIEAAQRIKRYVLSLK
ncbi:MAG: succinyldiaminopimelate transaminase [Oleiphilus sp.]